MATNSTNTSAFLMEYFYLSISRTVLCLFSTITNGICIAVFLSPKLKDVSFKYMLAQSISDFIYSFSLSFQILYFFPIDKVRFSLASQLYSIAIFSIVTSALAIFYILIAIWISLQRYLLFKNKKLLENISYRKIISFLLLLSFFYYFPAIFQNRIVIINNNSTQSNDTFFSTEETDFAKSSMGKILYIFLEGLRIFLNSMLLPFINVLTMIESKKRLRKKYELQAKNNIQSIKRINSKIFV